MKKILAPVFWLLLALLGAFAYATIAFKRGEPVNSGYLVIAAVCTYAIFSLSSIGWRRGPGRGGNLLTGSNPLSPTLSPSDGGEGENVGNA